MTSNRPPKDIQTIRLFIRVFAFLASIFFLFSVSLFLFRQPIFDFSKSIDSTRFYEFSQFTGGFLSFGLSIFSFLLIFLTYRLQFEELQNEKRRAELQAALTRYDQIVADIHDITYTIAQQEGSTVTFRGYDALYHWKEDEHTNPNSVLNHLIFILNSIEGYIKAVSDSNLIDNILKDELLARIYSMFHSKIIWPVMEHIYCSEKVMIHTDQELIYRKFDGLVRTSYAFLTEHDMLNEPDDRRIQSIIASSKS